MIRLLVAFEYAMKNWDYVGREWLGSFSRLSKTKVVELHDKRLNNNDESKSDLVAPLSDTKVYECLGEFAMNISAKPANSELSGKQCSRKSGNSAPTTAQSISEYKSDMAKRVMIFAIDEARALLDEDDDENPAGIKFDANKLTRCRLLLNALKTANEKIKTKYGNSLESLQYWSIQHRDLRLCSSFDLRSFVSREERRIKHGQALSSFCVDTYDEYLLKSHEG